jgi:hypothetical protein
VSPGDSDSEIVSEGVFFALFRVVEIEELYGPEKAVEWARSMVDDDEFRGAFAERLLARRAERDRRPSTD